MPQAGCKVSVRLQVFRSRSNVKLGVEGYVLFPYKEIDAGINRYMQALVSQINC